ncbi:DUF4336 domain-containing protein [uncultured Albimonas sp.]|uniref:DUF4336 domain-containing protein n=1 Tax=uncultured Albimonas sp. TaxID=1331701 RepID=UPI0030EC0F8D
MTRIFDAAYPPLDTLKPVAEDLWVVDGRPRRARGLRLPCRMTAVRLRSGAIWLHAPTAFDRRLLRAIEAEGPIRHLVAPSLSHWSHLADWAAAVPEATVWAPAALRRRRGPRREGLRVDRDLERAPPDDWSVEMDQLPIHGALGMIEVAFFHMASRTLLLTDLVQNLEPAKLGRLERTVLGLAGSLTPRGATPLHLRLALGASRPRSTGVGRRLTEADPLRVIFAHGRWFETDGAARLERALAWLTRRP